MKNLKKTVIFILSTGWLIPALYGLDNLQSWISLELIPILQNKPLLNSFPYNEFGLMLLRTSLIWLGLVISAWILYFFSLNKNK